MLEFLSQYRLFQEFYITLYATSEGELEPLSRKPASYPGNLSIMSSIGRLVRLYMPAIALFLVVLLVLQCIISTTQAVNYDEDGDVIMEDAMDEQADQASGGASASASAGGLDLNADATDDGLGLKL